jgi:hypothetical protein
MCQAVLRAWVSDETGTVNCTDEDCFSIYQNEFEVYGRWIENLRENNLA